MTFSKQARLLRSYEFRRVGKLGKEMEGRLVRLKILEGQYARKLGLTVSKKYGNAVHRNRFKRIAREAYRTLQNELPAGLHVLVTPHHCAHSASMPDIKQELADLLLKATPF